MDNNLKCTNLAKSSCKTKYDFNNCKENTLNSLYDVGCFLNNLNSVCKCANFVNLFKH